MSSPTAPISTVEPRACGRVAPNGRRPSAHRHSTWRPGMLLRVAGPVYRSSARGPRLEVRPRLRTGYLWKVTRAGLLSTRWHRELWTPHQSLHTEALTPRTSPLTERTHRPTELRWCREVEPTADVPPRPLGEQRRSYAVFTPIRLGCRETETSPCSTWNRGRFGPLRDEKHKAPPPVTRSEEYVRSLFRGEPPVGPRWGRSIRSGHGRHLQRCRGDDLHQPSKARPRAHDVARGPHVRHGQGRGTASLRACSTWNQGCPPTNRCAGLDMRRTRQATGTRYPECRRPPGPLIRSAAAAPENRVRPACCLPACCRARDPHGSTWNDARWQRVPEPPRAGHDVPAPGTGRTTSCSTWNQRNVGSALSS
jgi:hypothetical protein